VSLSRLRGAVRVLYRKGKMTDVFVFDTETIGLPNNGKRVRGEWPRPSNFNFYNSSRLVQIAWSVHDRYGKEVLSKECFIIKPAGFTIGNSSFHGITTEKALNEGVEFSVVYAKMMEALSTCNNIVAHNIDFDSKIIQAEACRAGLKDPFEGMVRFCTMQMGTVGNEKFPKLAELYQRCFGAPPSTVLHRADNDTEICAKIYFHFRAFVPPSCMSR